MKNGQVEVHDGGREDWIVHLVDTGLHTQTGGRVKRLDPRLREGPFRPPARFGGLNFEGDLMTQFVEKPPIGEGEINGAFLVLELGVLDYIDGDDTIFERKPLERLAKEGQFVAYRHEGFWQCMDTLRDVRFLERRWSAGSAPWKVWAE